MHFTQLDDQMLFNVGRGQPVVELFEHSHMIMLLLVLEKLTFCVFQMIASTTDLPFQKTKINPRMSWTILIFPSFWQEDIQFDPKHMYHDIS